MYPKGKADSVGGDYFPKSTTPNHLPHHSGLGPNGARGGYVSDERSKFPIAMRGYDRTAVDTEIASIRRSLEQTRQQLDEVDGKAMQLSAELAEAHRDRKSTRLNSSHVAISYAVFCL